jgi:LysR family glycine cleavage system transcriptional activator
MDWRDIPSLAALRGFEAAARLGSLSKAACELNVTHAAIAQHVRTVEAHLGLSLLVREGRGMALTDAGMALARPLSQGFAQIGAAVITAIRADSDRPLAVSLTSSFAEKWLMPRLGAFWKQHADIPLSLHPDSRVVDLARDGMDLAIRFGTGPWPGVESQLLLAAKYYVVAAPSLVAAQADLTIAELAALPWVMEDDWPEQRRWMAGVGIDPDTVNAVPVPTEELARAAARQGYGLHVEVGALLEDDLASGRLRVLYQGGSDDLGYYLVTRPGAVKPALRTFIRWLRSVA